MLESNSLEPYLPLELERLIFELAVSDNGTKISRPLLLVAKRVRKWTRPLIFRVMNRIRPSHLANLAILQSVGPFVQHLIIDGGLADASLRTVLSICLNISDLAFRHPFIPYGQVKWRYLLPILQEIPHLSRLTVGSLCVLSNDGSLVQLFLHLTHLSIHGSIGCSWGEWKVLTHLPKLTHLNVECVTQDLISKLLSLCPLLKLLVVLLYHRYRCSADLNGLYSMDDDRLVLLVGGEFYDDWVLDWERGANGAVDSWIFSERIVFARGRKYFSTPLPDVIWRNLDWEKYLNEEGKMWFHKLR